MHFKERSKLYHAYRELEKIMLKHNLEYAAIRVKDDKLEMCRLNDPYIRNINKYIAKNNYKYPCSWE